VLTKFLLKAEEKGEKGYVGHGKNPKFEPRYLSPAMIWVNS
jgi:hypothetical protein